jgi:molybdenum storage protein
LFDDDPKKNPNGEAHPAHRRAELLARNLPDLALERVVIEYLTRARACTELQIVNGLVKGNVTRALAGEDVGTIIYKD